jgi:hypothetical protein
MFLIFFCLWITFFRVKGELVLLLAARFLIVIGWCFECFLVVDEGEMGGYVSAGQQKASL